MPTKPNLFIIGAAKSGTTSLHHHLSAHPDIFMSEPKEPGFFVPEIDYYPRDEGWYLGLFRDGADARYRGESSTHYTKLPVYPGVVDRMAGFLQAPPRLIYLMRDPVDRAISHYWHNVRKFEEHRAIVEALRERVDYLAFSHYRMQLEPYVERFGWGALLPLTFEALTREPGTVVRRILRWLDLDCDVDLTSMEKRNARPATFRRVRGRGLLDRFARSAFWDRVSPHAPGWVKGAGRRLGYRDADDRSEQVDEAIRAIRPRAQEQVRELEAFLGTRFPEWTTTKGTSTTADARDGGDW
jgi:hypothetical protein